MLGGVTKTKMGPGEKSKGYFLQDFLVQRLAYLFIVVAAFLCIAAFVTHNELSVGRRKLSMLTELLAKKERTLEWRKGVISEKQGLIHDQQQKLDDINAVMSTKHRTLEWRKSVISEKQQEIDKLNGVISQHQDLLARKQRTLEWRREVTMEKQQEMNKQAKRDKKQLFEFRKVHALSEKVAHAKLVKMMTVMQNFLTRERKTQNIIKVSKQHLQKALDAHSAAIKGMSGELATAVQEKLSKLSTDLISAVSSAMDFATDEITGETNAAESRLEQLTKDLVEQLKENIASEKEDFRMMEIEDPDAFADFKEHLHHGSMANQQKHMQLAAEEKDFMDMIQEFYAKVKAMGDFHLSDSTLSIAKNLLTNVRRGEVDYKTGIASMKDLMNENSIKYKDNNIMDQFQQWLQAARFAPEKREMLQHLDQWQNGILGDEEILLFIEEKVASGAVALEWFATDK